MLLFVISAEAQTLAQIARKERERRANLKSVQVITADNSQAPTPPASPGQPAKPADSRLAEGSKAATPPATSAGAADAKSEAAGKKYAEELGKLRAKVVQLQDQETALQLQMNDLKNQFLSPVSDTTARSQAQTRLEQAQTQLSTVQKDLVDTKRAVQVMEAQGPPKG